MNITREEKIKILKERLSTGGKIDLDKLVDYLYSGFEHIEWEVEKRAYKGGSCV